jgi:DNA-binding MarR family transcriptional regulator
MPMPMGEGFRGPDGRVGYLMRQAQHTLRAALYQPLAEIGMTAAQYSVLSVADAEPGLSGAELARDTLLTPQTVNAIVMHLERSGLLERRPDGQDQRLRRVWVSRAGREVLAAARPAVWAVEQRMVASLTEAEQAAFRRHLTACALALDSRHASEAPPVHGFPGRSGPGTDHEEDVQ